MMKTCLAQDIGPEACYLISVVALQEDAKRYKGPVTYWNEQLAPVAGFANVKAMDRARAKAVASGWLVYIAGGKGKPGRYWVQIPEDRSDLPDGPIDETEPEFVAPKSTNKVGKKAGDNREESGEETGREAGGKREESGQHSYLSLSLPLSLNTPVVPKGDETVVAVEASHRVFKADVVAIYEAYPRHVARGAAERAIVRALSKIEPRELLSAVQAYAASRKGKDPKFTPHCATWMNQERWNDDRREWTRSDDGKHRVGAGEVYDPSKPPATF